MTTQIGAHTIRGPLGFRILSVFRKTPTEFPTIFASPIYGHQLWDGAKNGEPVVQTAQCVYCRGDRDVPNEEHQACGFHAHWLPEDNIEFIEQCQRSYNSVMVLFEGLGNIAVMEKGFRAEKGRIVGLVDFLTGVIIMPGLVADMERFLRTDSAGAPYLITNLQPYAEFFAVPEFSADDARDLAIKHNDQQGYRCHPAITNQTLLTGWLRRHSPRSVMETYASRSGREYRLSNLFPHHFTITWTPIPGQLDATFAKIFQEMKDKTFPRKSKWP